MNILYIDTRDNRKIVIRLKTDKAELIEESEANIQKAQASLPLIEKILKLAKMNVSEVDEIKVETGPGSFTGLRVGVAIANALSFGALKKVNGKPLGEIEEPKY